MRTPLELPDARWRWRWVCLPSWRVLHRLSKVTVHDAAWADDDDGWWPSEGTTVCGVRGAVAMPGVLSRMALPRCKHCCRGTGVPEGHGAPYNDQSLPEQLRVV